jgi:hypothetical protein
VSRHPERHDDVAIRGCRVWRPQDFVGHRIDFQVAERWLRHVCEGGCKAGHPKSMPLPGCEFCDEKQFEIPPLNVVQVCYDPFQLEDMGQSLLRDGIVWASQFDQGNERLIGDGLMFRMAMKGTLSHDGSPELREHIGNAKAKLQPDEESKMRIVKSKAERKIDAAVAAAMATKRCLDLDL